MNIAYAVYVTAVLVLLLSCWYRDWKHPYAQRNPHWNTSLSHKVAVVSLVLAIGAMLTFLWMYFKDQI